MSFVHSSWFAPSSRLSFLAYALVTAALGCSSPMLDGDVDLEEDVEDDGAPALREAWSNNDDPELLDASFTYALDELPLTGTADKLPWPGNFWPTYLDSINYRWGGSNTRSAAEKYGLAFGKSGVEDAVSKHFGVDGLPGAKCKWTSDCGKGQTCARRRGEKYGRCGARWSGLCHAWAPAALLEGEPRKSVVYNGVRFEINDIKALVSVAYTKGLKARFLSLRCEADSKHELDDTAACRDTNAGSFHVAVTNLLGIQGRAFIEDRSIGHEVWNFPVISYRVTRNKPISFATANDLLGASGSKYAFNKRAVELRRIRLELTFVAASDPEVNGFLTDDIEHFAYTDEYNYILELDKDGDIIGGEWTGRSRTDHPDFLWLPVKKSGATVAGVIDYADVEQLLKLAGGGS